MEYNIRGVATWDYFYSNCCRQILKNVFGEYLSISNIARIVQSEIYHLPIIAGDNQLVSNLFGDLFTNTHFSSTACFPNS